MKTYIIAEVGVNHNGSLEMAKELIKVAKDSGANAVKFQTFKAESLVTKNAEQAEYQIKNLKGSSSQFEMLKKLELSYEEFEHLQAFCKMQNIEFLSTPFDVDSADFLIDRLGIDKVKIPSGELTNAPFLHYIATKGNKMIVSTGMADLDEIHEALSYIAYGFANPTEPVNEQHVKTFYHTDHAKALLHEHVVLLHCTTQYPAPTESINLKAIKTLEQEFQVPVGFSDHSAGINLAMVAVGMGATVVEKHFTLDRSLEGPDHKASLEPDELKAFVSGIREVETALGDGIKRPSENEFQNRIPARKSIVAKESIRAGEEFTMSNITVKRPGSGIEPKKYWALLGKKASRDFKEDELIEYS